MKKVICAVLCLIMLLSMMPVPAAGETLVQKPASIAAAYPGENYVWYNGNDYTASEDMYVEIVEEGAEDMGAIHVYQKNGVVGAEDMRIHLQTDVIPAGTYTLQYNLKGSDLGIEGVNDSCRFYLPNDAAVTTQFRTLAGSVSLDDWTALSETITTANDSDFIVLGISKYVYGADFYVDNVKLLNASGEDMLGGAGDFYTYGPEESETTEPEATEPETTGPVTDDSGMVAMTLHSADPGEKYQWYNGNGFTATDDMYIEIVSDGADDVGSIHVFQTDGVTGTEDMRVNLLVDAIPAGTYTLKFKIKGTDLGNTDTNNANRFYVSGHGSLFSLFRNLAGGTKTFASWKELSETVTTTSDQTLFSLMVSKYVNGADYYVDNVRLLDADGNDVLGGAGNFCTVPGGESQEPTEGLTSIDTSTMCSAYNAPNGQWTPMYPSGSPNSSTWPAWDETHYGEVVGAGYKDRGSLHLKSVSYKNAAVAIGVDMVVGETYTLGLWAKGTSNSGRVLAQYSNGDPTIIGASSALTSDWSYYECVFTASQTQLNLVASDWGATNIYIDNITLIGSDGADLLDGYGDFCTEEYRMEDPKYLLSFNQTEEAALQTELGQVSVEGASDPTLTLTADDAETGNALQATWSYDGTNPSYLHRYVGDADGYAGIFAQNAVKYRYLRMWISNPSHLSVDVSILLSGEDTVNYFDTSAMKLIRKDGTEVQGSRNDNSGYGENSCISVPKQFTGWLSVPLTTDGLLAASESSTVISDFSAVTGMTLEVRKIATTDGGDVSDYYYVLDDICLSQNITGTKQSTEDSNQYADYDTSVKGSGQVKNVIFLIGDGMGYGALDAARLDRAELYIDTIASLGGVVGEVATTNLYGDVTDSAAAGTALSTGFLTRNTVLGLSENYEPIMNLGEYMKQLGKKLGLVTTTYVLDATPAAFASHTSDRGNYTSIAKDIMELGVDVVQGGGRSYLSAQVKDDSGSAVTLTELAVSKYGYQYAVNVTEMDAVTSGKLWGIYQNYNMSWMKDECETDPTLAEMTAKTFQLLENDEGFFAMIEGGQIDIAGHDNSAEDTRLETLAFDDAVKVAMDYVDANPDTLLIVTADHETGGVRVAEDGSVSYYTASHTDELVPYYAYGTGAEYFEDLTVNTQISHAIRRATIGDVSTVSTSVPTETALSDTELLEVSVEDGMITYTGADGIGELTLTDGDAVYAVLKYMTDDSNLVGTMDASKIYYAGDGKWHVSDVLALSAGQTHTFQPISYIKGELYNSIDIAGKSLQIDWVGFFDSYEGACAFQAEAALTGATPSGMNGLSMTLGDDLELQFYVAANEIALEDTTVSITQGSQTVTYGIADGVWDAATGNYVFCAELAAAQMTDSVTFSLAVGEKVLETGDYSVRQYADQILDESNGFDDVTKALVREMLNYGAKAQSYFGYREDSLANADIAGAGESAVPESTTEMVVADSMEDLAFYAASLLFRSKTAVRFYFTGSIADCAFTVNGQTLPPVEKDGMYYVEIGGIDPAELAEQIALTVTRGEETVTVSYSPMNYIVRMSAKGTETLKALLQALYNYHLAAAAYEAAQAA